MRSGVSVAKEEHEESDAASVADFEERTSIAGDVSGLSPPLADATAAMAENEREAGRGRSI